MPQTREEIPEILTERLCWEVARRDDSRIARRLYRKQVVDEVSRLDEGALWDEFFPFLRAIGVIALLEDVHGTAIQREMVPFVQDILLYGLKTLFGIERITALPSLLFSDEALMQLGGFTAQQGRDGLCHRGSAKRQGERRPGPICPDTLAKNIVKLQLRDLEGLFNGAIRAVAKAGIFGKQVTGIADGTDLETTARYTGCGQVTRKRRIEATRGQVHAIEGTVYGWKVRLLIDARTKIPLAVKVGPMDEHETHWTRALVTQARANVAGGARWRKIVFDKGFGDGPALWWLAQHDRLFVVPAKAHRAGPPDAQAQAAAGDGITVARRVHTVRHGQGQGARTERLATEVVGITGLTTDDQ